MDTRDFCVYNQARGVFLSSKVTVADSANEPLKMLKVLVGGLGVDAESGLLLFPLRAAPAVPRLFPFDLLYLDNDNQVVDALEIVPGVEFPAFRGEVASALLVAHHILQSTKTARGDRLLIGHKEEIEQEIGTVDTRATEPLVLNGKSSGESKSAGKGLAALLGAVSSRFAVRASALVMPGSAVAAPAPATIPEIVAQLPTDDARSETGTPVISITEVVLERPPSLQAATINGQHGGVEDLFSNWVDAPTFASGWIAHNEAPEAKRAEVSRTASVDSVPTPLEAASESTVSRAAREPVNEKPPSVEPTPAAVSPEVKQSPQRDEKPEMPARRGDANETPKKGTGTFLKPMPSQGNRWVRPQVPTEVSDSTRVAQASPLATAYTVAQYGMWQLGLPTPGTSSAAANGPLAGRTSAPANGSSKPEKVQADLKKTATMKTPESERLAENLRVSANIPLFSSSAKPRQEKPPTPTGIGQVAIPNAPDLEPTADVLKTAAERLPDRGVGSAGQLQAAETTVLVSADAEKPKVQASDSSPAQIEQVAKHAGTSEPLMASNGTAPAPSTSKQVDEKKKTAATPLAGSSISQRSSSPAKPEQPGKIRISTQPGNANGKAKEQPLSLGMRFKRWLNPVTPTSSDRRKAYRRYVPGMVAHYYTGGAPKPHDVADISMTGIYLLTEDRWIPETMIQMTLQKPCARGERKQSITVLAKVVRQGSDGLAAQFVMPETLDRNSHDVQPAQTTDRFALARFI